MLRSASLMLTLFLIGCGSRSLPHEGKSVEQLRKMLDDNSPAVQAQGALGLSLHGRGAAAAVPRLTELLKSSEVQVRRQAALALGKIGPEARESVGPLVALLDDPEWSVRRQSAIALGEIGGEQARPALRKRTKDESKLVRQAASQALERLR